MLVELQLFAVEYQRPHAHLDESGLEDSPLELIGYTARDLQWKDVRHPPLRYTNVMPLRLLLLANRDKPQVNEALETFRPWLAQRADIVADPDIRELDTAAVAQLPAADLAMVFGGDGTMLGLGRRLLNTDIPLLGVNFGKVGFLAEFNLADVKQHWDQIVAGKCRMTERLMIETYAYAPGAPEFGGNGEPPPGAKFHSVAMNDAVIAAGPPYRMIELELAIEPSVSRTSATSFSGDGVVVATPSGSTAYNLATGGPIVMPGVNGLSITAICPQSLAFRPIIVQSSCDIWFRLKRANEGTTLVIDGQQSVKLDTDDQVFVRAHTKALRLVHNPNLNYWMMLAKKMHWAARPRR
jgi:NAD+ kinase